MIELNSAAQMASLGRELASVLLPGDVVILDGVLGAGKTTLTRGIGEGLAVRGPITSPTFVIARVHPALNDGPPLVHVDAYRVESLADVDSLDLDASLEESVTVVEWGVGRVEQLTDSYLLLQLGRSATHGAGGDSGDSGIASDTHETRTLEWDVVGAGWQDRIPQLANVLGASRN